jgi:hypothetical protein
MALAWLQLTRPVMLRPVFWARRLGSSTTVYRQHFRAGRRVGDGQHHWADRAPPEATQLHVSRIAVARLRRK